MFKRFGFFKDLPVFIHCKLLIEHFSIQLVNIKNVLVCTYLKISVRGKVLMGSIYKQVFLSVSTVVFRQ